MALRATQRDEKLARLNSPAPGPWPLFSANRYTEGLTRERKTQILTIAALAVALAVALGQKQGWRWGQGAPKEPPSPQDAIYAMLDAARAGDVGSYLAC